MNGIIEESTLERMEDIRGKPIRRGLDKAINECLDKLENEGITKVEWLNPLQIEKAMENSYANIKNLI